jgi:APA family basic amino acid/polyamine antiporter
VPDPAVAGRAADATTPAASSGGGLHRVIRVRDGLAVSVGIVIGAGILRTPGLIASYLGDAWLILGVWLLGGVIAGLSTLLLAEMAAAMPSAGGKYVYAREAWGPTAGFVAGWAEIIVSRGFSGAAKAVVIATYGVELAGRGSVSALAGVIVLFFALLHLGGLRVGTTFQNVTSMRDCSASRSPTRPSRSRTTAGKTPRRWPRRCVIPAAPCRAS